MVLIATRDPLRALEVGVPYRWELKSVGVLMSVGVWNNCCNATASRRCDLMGWIGVGQSRAERDGSFLVAEMGEINGRRSVRGRGHNSCNGDGRAIQDAR